MAWHGAVLEQPNRTAGLEQPTTPSEITSRGISQIKMSCIHTVQIKTCIHNSCCIRASHRSQIPIAEKQLKTSQRTNSKLHREQTQNVFKTSTTLTNLPFSVVLHRYSPSNLFWSDSGNSTAILNRYIQHEELII